MIISTFPPRNIVHMITWIGFVVGFFTAIAEMTQGKNAAEVLEASASALFAQIPEGLLPTATIALLIASFQMADVNVLVRKLDAVETLGCCSVVCSDKTGGSCCLAKARPALFTMC